MDYKRVDELVIGDRFVWCGRTVQVAWLEHPRLTRQQRRTKVDVTVVGDQRPLHYFADELVDLPS